MASLGVLGLTYRCSNAVVCMDCAGSSADSDHSARNRQMRGNDTSSRFTSAAACTGSRHCVSKQRQRRVGRTWLLLCRLPHQLHIPSHHIQHLWCPSFLLFPDLEQSQQGLTCLWWVTCIRRRVEFADVWFEQGGELGTEFLDDAVDDVDRRQTVLGWSLWRACVTSIGVMLVSGLTGAVKLCIWCVQQTFWMNPMIALTTVCASSL
jgi:hypothetical protein